MAVAQKHFSGPLRVRHSEIGILITEPRSPIHGRILGIVPHLPNAIDGPRIAALFALSPDLLAVAQMVLATASDTTPPELLAAATAAVAKAEGR